MACNDKNPLIREGVDRLTRALGSLSPDFAPVDNRSMEDLMLFAKRYAVFLNYKNKDNANDGTWEDLMKTDITVVLAMLLSIDVFKLSDYIKLIIKKTKLAIAANNETEAKRQFKYLFDLVFTLAHTVDEQCTFLKDEPDYQKEIKAVIETKLNAPFSKLHNFKKDNQDLILMSNKTDASAPITTINSRGTIQWTNFSITEEKLKITIPGLTPVDKISHVINHNLFNNQINQLLGGVSSILKKSEVLFQQSLTEYPKHEAHYALFLTFLELFKNAQASLNQYTKKHLDFYFKDVLRVKNQEPVPDKTHLVIGLQKHIKQHLLTKGTLFKGGKDSAGNERFYSLTEDVVFNQSQVSEIKAFQMHDQNLLSFGKANSSDGNGQEFEGEDKSWSAFGIKQSVPTSDSGFAIASNLLFLKEGHRTIEIKITFGNLLKTKTNFITTKFSKKSILIPFEISLTGDKEWVTQSVDGHFDPLKNSLTLKFILDVEEPPIIPYSEKIHESNFDTVLPLLKAKLNQTESQVTYSELMNSNISTIKLSVAVIGVKDLALSSDGGSIDASKPFKPFGDFPKSGSGFYIGSKEVFQKNLDSLTLNFPVGVPHSSSYLFKNTWNFPLKDPIIGDSYELIPESDFLKPATVDFSPNQLIQQTSFEGFLRLQLGTNKFSMSEFMKRVSSYVNQMVEKAKPKEGTEGKEGKVTVRAQRIEEGPTSAALLEKGTSLDKQLITELEKVGISKGLIEEISKITGTLIDTSIQIPVAEEVISEDFSLDYKASKELIGLEINSDKNRFYHLTPFGFSQQNLQGEVSLIPRFDQEGELLIGIEKATPPQTIQLLFLLEEGSSNPLKSQEQVYWHFLENNKWVEFPKERIIDGTINLTRSGLVSINFPKEASLNHTILTSGLLWIRLSVTQNTDAVCRVLDIKTQGALVELVQDEKVEFREILASNSIAKLKNSDSSIKSISQPTSSFHGRKREEDQNYYQRISERLRHKQRAKNIWDYEHLILQQFPEIHKTKCLNHTGFYVEQGIKVFCENYPGNVTVICIPDQKENAHANPLRPYTPVGLLTDISLFLEKLKNPFVSLHVVNPKFEEVQADFEVHFHDFMDEVFYRNLLDQEIEQFLCPWAFDSNKKITFGGSIHQSALINFIEERPYVDFVSCFKLSHIIRNENGIVTENKSNLELVTATSSRSVLVSHFDEKQTQPRHKIKVIQTCDC
jgi:hypothetical protein